MIYTVGEFMTSLSIGIIMGAIDAYNEKILYIFILLFGILWVGMTISGNSIPDGGSWLDLIFGVLGALLGYFLSRPQFEKLWGQR